MCELGTTFARKDGLEADPHVFSSMTPSKVMVVGQNPGWDELRQGRPFVGQAGKIFDVALERHGVVRTRFYITNAVKCWTSGNSKPSPNSVERCSAFLRMELNLLNPLFVVTLGAVAFESLCDGLVFSESLGKFVDSVKFGVKVFPIYHPSPLNLSDADRKTAFLKQISLLCGILQGIDRRSA
jgi:DNA polymerase